MKKSFYFLTFFLSSLPVSSLYAGEHQGKLLARYFNDIYHNNKIEKSHVVIKDNKTLAARFNALIRFKNFINKRKNKINMMQDPASLLIELAHDFSQEDYQSARYLLEDTVGYTQAAVSFVRNSLNLVEA